MIYLKFYISAKRFLLGLELTYEFAKYDFSFHFSYISIIFEFFTHNSMYKIKCSQQVIFTDKLRFSQMFQARFKDA